MKIETFIGYGLLVVVLSGCDPVATTRLLIHPEATERAIPSDASTTIIVDNEMVAFVEEFARRKGFSQTKGCDNLLPKYPELAESCREYYRKKCSYFSKWQRPTDPSRGLTELEVCKSSAGGVQVRFTDYIRYALSEQTRRLSEDLLAEIVRIVPKSAVEVQ